MQMWETVKRLKESVGMVMQKDINIDLLSKIDIFSKKGNGQQVEFTFYAPKATKVSLAGKFNDWNTKSLPMKKNKDGYWTVTINLSPGRYEYKYVIDGAWAQDAVGAEKVRNSFGTYNNVIGVA